jgi:very-short-patch-repair endonuclease
MYDDDAVRLATAHNGVVSTHLLRLHGADDEVIRALRESRHWSSESRYVLVRHGSPTTREQALTIAVFGAGPAARLSHEPACWLWGQSSCRTVPVDVVRTSRSGTRPDGVRVHTVRHLPDPWVTVLRGVPVVKPELCALQLFASCHPARAERLVERMWAMRLLSGPSLRRFIAEMGRSGRNGTAGIRDYLDARPADYVPSATNLETRTMQILRDAWIHVRRQVDAGSEEAWTGRVDFVVDGLPIVIEVQSQAHHTALADVEADRRRRADLEAAGWIWVEVWDTEVWTTPETVVAKVRAAIADARARRRHP